MVAAVPAAALFDAPVQASEPIAFSRVVTNIQAGTGVGRYIFGWNCAPGDFRWAERYTTELRSPEYGARFGGVLSEAGYRIVGESSRLFESDAERAAARYLVGARLIGVQYQVCDDSGSARLNRISGAASVTLEWEVYSVAQRRVIYTTRTDGNARTETPSYDGRAVLTRQAFAQATANLARDPGFRAVVSGQPVDAAPDIGGASLDIPRYALSRDSINNRFNQVRAATVIVRTAHGHGSGFFVSDDGLILTNQHVVGEADAVNVRLLSGVEVTGRVLRRHALRDVALVKVDLSRIQPLPLRAELPRVGEEVYAIGAPVETRLAASVTRGIVSAVRRELRGGVELGMIQSDAVIHGGNSGGPLLDASGNVVGIAVEAISGGGQLGSGTNFFIPIDEALQNLNLRLGQPRELRF